MKASKKENKAVYFSKGVKKKNPRRLNRGNSTVRSFRKQKTIESFCMFINLTPKKKKKESFDRESKNPKQKRIKSKPIQQKNLIKSNISYPNLKNGGKKKTMYGAQSMQCLPFCLCLCFFLRVLGLIFSLFHRLSLSQPLSVSLPFSISDPKNQSINQNQIWPKIPI